MIDFAEVERRLPLDLAQAFATDRMLAELAQRDELEQLGPGDLARGVRVIEEVAFLSLHFLGAANNAWS